MLGARQAAGGALVLLVGLALGQYPSVAIDKRSLWSPPPRARGCDEPCITRLPWRGGVNATGGRRSGGAHEDPACATEYVDTLVYAHNQKAGGTSVKASLVQLCSRCRWVCWFPHIPHLRRWTEALVPEELNAASYVERWFALPQHARDATRVLFGDQGRTISACKYVGGRCVYAINIREPTSQMVSHYNYFCVAGAEGRHKWTARHRAQGYCDAAFMDWSMGGIPLAARLTGCPFPSPETAIANVRHPCVWALHLDRFGPLLKLLGQKLGAPWSQQLSSGGIHANANHRRRLESRAARHVRAHWKNAVPSAARPATKTHRKAQARKRSPFASWFFVAGRRPARKIRIEELTSSLIHAMRALWDKNAAIKSAFFIHEAVSRDSTEAKWIKRPLLTC